MGFVNILSFFLSFLLCNWKHPVLFLGCKSSHVRGPLQQNRWWDDVIFLLPVFFYFLGFFFLVHCCLSLLSPGYFSHLILLMCADGKKYTYCMCLCISYITFIIQSCYLIRFIPVFLALIMQVQKVSLVHFVDSNLLHPGCLAWDLQMDYWPAGVGWGYNKDTDLQSVWAAASQ